MGYNAEIREFFALAFAMMMRGSAGNWKKCFMIMEKSIEFR